MPDLANLEERVFSLETSLEKVDGDVSAILSIAQKLEHRLVGSLDSETPGLITQVQELKKTVGEAKEEFRTINVKLVDVQKAFDQLNKYKWISYGVILAVGSIVGYVLKFFAILVDKNH
jgi:predicted  nucleic acid-binding Zn-ribbon protein